MVWFKRGTVAAVLLVVIAFGGSLPVGASSSSHTVFTWDYQYNSGPVAVGGQFDFRG